MNKFIKILKTSKILIPVFVISIFLGIFLFFYIPKIMEEGIIKNIVSHSKNSVERLQLQREYYVDAVVGDIKKYAPNLSFDYNHKGLDGKLPFPTTTVHDLSQMYSQRGDVKFSLYSKYPFLNRKNRELTEFQKEALDEVEKNDEGMFYKKDIINGKEVLRVVVVDYMVLPACVTCHNTHKLKDWDFQWKLGDKRGVLEIITPMDVAIGDMKDARNNIVITALSLMMVLFIYYAYVLIRRESQLHKENELLSEDLADLFEDFDKHVIASKTDLSGKITYASKKFCKITGYSQEEIIGKNHNLIRHTDTPKEIFKEMWARLNSDKTWMGELKNKKKNGEYYWVDAVVSPLYGDDGEKIGYSAIRQDITNKKIIEELNLTLENRVEEEVEKNRQKDKHILQQSRLAQMGEMISMIAHQWRQPLSAISSTSIALGLKAKLGKVNKEMIIERTDNIEKYSSHLSNTIDDFRNFYKSDKELKKTSYDEVLNSVFNIVKVSIKNKNIEIIEDYNCSETFRTYPSEIKHVILNIIKNAEDILLDKKIEKPYIKISTFKKDNNYVLTILDNAGGINDEIIDKVFDPYFSTKDEKNGTGLGLYMSKVIIQENCKGKLTVLNTESIRNRKKEIGALFSISIPSLVRG